MTAPTTTVLPAAAVRPPLLFRHTDLFREPVYADGQAYDLEDEDDD